MTLIGQFHLRLEPLLRQAKAACLLPVEANVIASRRLRGALIQPSRQLT
jgi:hypothetical protein